MIDVFYEETVKPTDRVHAGKQYKRMQFLSIIFLLSAILCTIFLFLIFNMPFSQELSPTTFFLTILLPVIIMCVITYTIYFILKNKKHRYLVDYDYTFISGELRIARVLNNIKRKSVAKIQCSDISVFGKTSSDKYLRYKTMPNMKTIIATPNVETNEDGIYFAVCMYNGYKTILLIEPTANLIYNIKKFAGRTVDYV